MRNLARQRILVVAPYPPPYGGTTVPTQVLEEWLLGKNYRVDRVNTTSGDKTGIPLIHPRALFPFVRMLVSFLGKVFFVDMVIVMGDPRFSATAGTLFVHITRVFNKSGFVYIHGGHFDHYVFSMSRTLRSLLVWFMSPVRIIVQTKWLRSVSVQFFRKVTAIPNWTQLPPNTQVRKLEKGRCIFGFVGQIRHNKGIADLLIAFKQVRSRFPHVALELVGQIDTFFRSEFERVLEEVGEGVYLYSGNRTHSETMSRMGSCDILVYPTRYPFEGYPGAVIEAFARGIPVIATAWRAVPEIVKDGVNGLLVDPDNVARELPEAMMKLAGDPELYERLSAGALESAKRFDIEVVGPRLLKLLEEK